MNKISTIYMNKISVGTRAFRKGVGVSFHYRDADKSLARRGRKQARKHVRDARDFNTIETRAVIK
jgi:trehalose-6-phosphatase